MLYLEYIFGSANANRIAGVAISLNAGVAVVCSARMLEASAQLNTNN